MAKRQPSPKTLCEYEGPAVSFPSYSHRLGRAGKPIPMLRGKRNAVIRP
jgi:hypothetical protein